MELVDFLSKYFQLISFIGVVIGSWVKYSNDLSNLNVAMKSQKETHDLEIADLKIQVKANEIKVDQTKDKLGDVINLMQQDIREIMTILKAK